MAPRRANTSRHAILGVLSFCPMSGYDVKKLIGRSIAHFWNESYGQIYPILKRLAAEGLAERRRETQRGKPDRHVYSLTAKGREELARWLAVPARSEPARSELLLKLFLGGAGRPADSLAQVEHFEARQRELLATYDGIERQLRKEMRELVTLLSRPSPGSGRSTSARRGALQAVPASGLNTADSKKPTS